MPLFIIYFLRPSFHQIISCFSSSGFSHIYCVQKSTLKQIWNGGSIIRYEYGSEYIGYLYETNNLDSDPISSI